MANEEHLKILRQGVEVWNRWREDNPEVWPDLSGTYLGFANLVEADLSRANLSRVNLLRANLIETNLSEANLSEADLQWAILIKADLSGAKLSEAYFGFANLTEANLTEADLIEANLSGANLIEANLTGALLYTTVFGQVNLKGAIGLDKCDHLGPSIIDHQTISLSGMLPVVFLRGCGLPDSVIGAYRGLVDQPYYSCFISYSHADKVFATALHDRLQDKGIRCWRDEHQILPGDDTRDAIDRGVSLWDKVLLCCSESSLNSYWVNTEIDKALEKEQALWRERGKETLAVIPLNLDGYVFKWDSSRASELTKRHAEDLVGWENDPVKLERALERIEKALRADEGGREKPPEPKL